jgi:FtsH-binding integral membrane protein
MPVSLLASGSASHASSATSVTIDIVISVAVLLFILYRQVQVRRASPNPALPVVLLILGVVSLTQGSGRPTAAELGYLIALLAVDAVALGALRAWTVKLWRDGQSVLRQGTWVTVVLWVVGLGIHEAVDALAHIPASSTLLYVGVTFLAQQLVVQARVSRLERQPLGPAPDSSGTPAGQAGTGGIVSP